VEAPVENSKKKENELQKQKVRDLSKERFVGGKIAGIRA